MGSHIEVQRTTLVLVSLVAALSLICTGLGVALNKYVVYTDADTPPTGTEGSTVATTMAPTEPWEKEYRLPGDVIPIHYDVYLHPNLETDLFSGYVSIQLDVQSPRTYILIHTKLLEITETIVVSDDDSTYFPPISRAFEYTPNEFWVIEFSTEIPTGKYTVNLKFNGNLKNGIVGLYKSEYTNDKGEKRAIATSKFQPTYARRAFPCLDEPGFKPTYKVSLVRPSDGYIALSNMPETKSIPDAPSPGLTTVEFEQSVKMVTYLACFIVCDFQFLSGEMSNGKTMRVFATPHQKDNVEYALEVGLKITNFYDEYFGIEYVLPKQDMIAIPDFVSGAMEHWGLITYRETALLYNNITNSPSNKQRVATVIAHELAHQWFGNLMTIKWWDDLWLNEGFASYMEYKGVIVAEPDWDMDTLFLTDDLIPVLQLDSKLSSHPIVVPVTHPDEITEIFDAISYNKGASVLRMLEFFMGPMAFQEGIKEFLETYKFDNAVTLDLWNILSKYANGLDIPLIMDTWTKQMGFPYLSVTKSGNKYTIRQQRYLVDPETAKSKKLKESPFNYKWEVPVSYITNLNKEPEIKWLHMNDDQIEITVPDEVTWVKFNNRFTGFYRVNYPEDVSKVLSDLLKTDTNALEAADRASLIDDSFSLAESGHSSFSVALDMVAYLTNERHPTPWSAARSSLGRMKTLLRDSAIYIPFRNYLKSLATDPALDIGWDDDDSHLSNLLRSTILDFACDVNVDDIVTAATNRFQQWIQNPGYYLSPNIRTIVYKYGMSSIGNEEIWKTVWDRYLQEADVQEKTKLLQGLASVQDPYIINQYLILAKNDSFVRSQDYFSVLQYISGNPIGEPLVWNFVRDEWQYLVDRFTLNDRYLGNMVKSITSRFSKQVQLDEMEKFFMDNPEAGAGARAREQALETVRNNIKWVKNNTPIVESWLRENGWIQ
ncbi:glutamyl aminopeptidase-like isoform X1 [Artemia franciscana]|uniref:glutamyl aminopeptidase-like isoform X1 n=2 Tax=Artemia franciscana TaxID=6661 RepID=UPI0032D9F18F